MWNIFACLEDGLMVPYCTSSSSLEMLVFGIGKAVHLFIGALLRYMHKWAHCILEG